MPYESGALTVKDPVLCSVWPSPLLSGETHAWFCRQTLPQCSVRRLRKLQTVPVTEGSDMRSA